MTSRGSTTSPIIRKPSLFRPPRRRVSPPLPAPLLQTLRTLLVLLVLWCEYGTFYSHTALCSFDDSPSTKGRVWDSSLAAGGGGWRADETWVGATPYHVLIVADPQLLDMRSYPGRNWILRWMGVKFTDAYARKSWNFVRRVRGKDGPLDGIVWLGDLLDSGVEIVDRKECVLSDLGCFVELTLLSR
jgi:hypothetical protein